MTWFSKDKFILPMRGVWRELYLDTNAWSELAKGNRPSNRLDDWLQGNSGFLTMSPHAAIELCRRQGLAEKLVDFMAGTKDGASYAWEGRDYWQEDLLGKLVPSLVPGRFS